MKYHRITIDFSLVAMLATLSSADAAIRIGNHSRSYADAYNAVNQQIAQVEYANAQYAATVANPDNATDALPVRVANADLAQKIVAGTDTTVGMSGLERCARIYPEGQFEWARPTGGIGAGGAATCVAVVEMRGLQMGPNGSDAVLARASVAAGDTIKCNISDFPEASYTNVAGEITFPSDSEPTHEDVIRILNQEQKQNAALKIAGSAIVGAVAGNFVGKSEIGQDTPFGTGKSKMKSTAAGAVAGAAIGAGNAYAGKVGGDVILSTGVNAAAGAAVGNMMATGDAVLRIEDCKIGGITQKCLWGILQFGEEYELVDATDTADVDAAKNDSTRKDAKVAFFNIQDGQTIVECDLDYTHCVETNLINVRLSGAYKDKIVSDLKQQDFAEIKNKLNSDMTWHIETQNGRREMKQGSGSDTAVYTPISSAQRPGRSQNAMIVGVSDTVFGIKRSNWNEFKAKLGKNPKIVGRTPSGEAFDFNAESDDDKKLYNIDNFYPISVDTTSGGIVDFGNKARMKSTLIGAGAGGALGAFSGYQGAQQDIEDRWLAAVREYKDSLGKIYCITGKRYLSQYNDMVNIPKMSE